MLEGELKRLVAVIRETMEAEGGCTVGRAQLRLISPDELTVAQQFLRIAVLAQQQGWSFAFLPDGAVHFGTFTPLRVHSSGATRVAGHD